MAKNASTSTQRRWSRGPGMAMVAPRLHSVGAVHAVLVPDRHQHAAVGVAAHGLRPVAGRAGPAAAGHPVVAARHPAPGRPRHLAGRHRAIGQSRLGGRRLGAGAARLPAAGLGLRPDRRGAAAPRGWQAGDRRRLVRAGVRRLDLRRALRDGRAVRRPAGAARRAALDLLSGAVGGMVAGIGIGWLANLLRRARRSTEVAPCA